AGYVAALFLALGLLGFATANADKAQGQAALRLLQTSPLWRGAISRPLSPQEFRRRAAELGLAYSSLNRATATAPRPRRDLNVVLVFMESTYNQHLSLFSGMQETQPLLSKYRDRM